MTAAPHILILGGGYAGFHAARGLRRAALSGRVRVTVVEPRPYMTYKPLLPEVAGGHTQPRDVTVDLSRPLSFATVVGGTIESVDCRSKTAVIRTLDGTERATRYDHVVLALGAVTKAAPISGLAEHAVGFESLEEAVFLRNHVLDRIQSAASTTDAAVRNRALSFVFVGGGYTGVEAMAELQDLASRAHASYPTLDQAAQHWILVEAAGRIATELPPSLSDWTLRLLRRRGITVKTNTEMRSCENGIVHLTDGTQLGADTIVWAAGVTPNPELDRTNAPRGSKGHVQANARLQVIDNDGTPLPGAWAIGDNAEIPNLTAPSQPAFCPPTAQHALRQAQLVADNILRVLDGTEPFAYRHTSLGTLASFGARRGAGVVKGVPVRGQLAWVIDKAYHGAALPSMSRRIRLAANWAANVLAIRDLTSTSAVQHPRRTFERAIAGQTEEKNHAP